MKQVQNFWSTSSANAFLKELWKKGVTSENIKIHFALAGGNEEGTQEGILVEWIE